MPEAATAQAQPQAGNSAAAAAPSATANTPAAPQAAGAQLQSVPAGAEWINGIKSEELKTFIQNKKYSSLDALAESHFNIEKLKGVPEDRLLKIPEKLEGDEARSVFQRLGAPKEAKGYELPADDKTDPQFNNWAQDTFYEMNLTKGQGQGLVNKFNSYVAAQTKAQQEAAVVNRTNQDQALRKEWGGNYEKNVEIAKQGVKILGLDSKTLDLMEAMQGRDTLFKTLHKIGVGVGESQFVDGQQASTETPEQAQAKIKDLMNDKKFYKRMSKGDLEARKEWDRLNEIAAPGTIEIQKFR